jgi:inhibitor of cysteine peptidase
MKPVIMGILLASIMIAPGCIAQDAPKKIQDEVVKLTAADNGKTITTVAGTKIEIRLKGNPTSGYEWILVKMKSKAVRADGKGEYIPDKFDPPRMGSGGVFLFRFVASKPGNAIIDLEYLRVWENDVPPIEKYSITVIVPDE